jgi:NAD(P)-dependent dehydrogenase (short-subunit alcohol dehydrogenase family)
LYDGLQGSYCRAGGSEAPSMYLEKFRVDGQLAVVTGGGQGIGLACAHALGEAGAEVAILERDGERGEAAVAQLAETGVRARAFACDVTDSGTVTAIADELASGGRPASILVNNAGIAESDVASEAMPDAVWLKILDVNLNGTYWCCRAFGRHMLDAGGSIVNIGSMSGLIVNRPQLQAHYNASKAAVHHLTRSLAVEWAPRSVRVNAVAPTYVNTPLNRIVGERPDLYARWMDGTPMNRMGEDFEVASVVLFLASEASSLMTGSVVLADGGYSSW